MLFLGCMAVGAVVGVIAYQTLMWITRTPTAHAESHAQRVPPRSVVSVSDRGGEHETE